MSSRLKCFIFIITIENVLIARDFLFKFFAHANITFHAHLIDVKMHEIFIKNDIDRIVKVLKKIRLDTLSEFDYKNVFFVEQFLRKPFTNINWIKKVVIIVTIIAFSISFIMINFLSEQKLMINVQNVVKEKRLFNDVMIYRNTKTRSSLTKFITKFSSI